MSYQCYFNRLPIELLHILFDYFTAHELLYSFFHINGYIDEVLHSYSTYRLNFQSIQKANFDLVYRHIRLDRVISLTLSDDNDTPGLPQLFLSRFLMEQFTRLRSLTLIQIENYSLRLISSNLYQFNQLRSLSINAESIRSIRNHRINSHLRYLKLAKCSDDELEIIWQYLPQLKSLDVCLNLTRWRFTHILPPFNQLIRLNLQIENYHASMDEMKQFLKNLPDLKHLQLKTKGSTDLFDGDRWKTLTETYHTFNFHFTARFFPNENIFKSFCTPFWLEGKRWFVAYQDYALFSIPHFAPKHIDIPQQSYIRSTVPNDTFLYDRINKMVIKSVGIKHHHYFNHIETLELKYSASLKTIASIMNLNSIKHLSVFSLDDVLKFIPLEDSMPHLCQLTVENEVTIDRIKRVNYYRFEQIHKLEIGVNEKQSDWIIEKLSMIFPCTQYLIYKSPIHSKETTVRLIHRFQCLTNVSFLVDIWTYRREVNFLLSPNSIVQCARKSGQGRFIRRIYGSRIVDSLNDRLQFYYWIGEEPCTRLQFIYWLLNLRYNWDRFKHTLSHFLIYVPLAIMISFMEFIGGLEIELFYCIRNWNIYVVFISILFLSIAFTFTMISLPFMMKLFNDCIDQ